MAIPGYVAPAKNVSVGGQYYELSGSGMTAFMRQLRQSNPQAHTALEPNFKKIDRRDTWSKVATWGGAGAGAAIAGIGLASQAGSAPIFIGVALIGLGPFIGYLLAPSQQDWLEFINEHNRVNPRGAAKISAAFTPFPGGGMALATLSF